jgi:Icc protein
MTLRFTGMRSQLTAACTALLSFTFSACSKFEYSPYEVRIPDDTEDINQKAIDRILSQPISATDTLQFLLISDTQRFYDETADFVKAANKQKNIRFVMLTGDITDFGLTKEFQWIHSILQKLNFPYLGVIGNHDCLGNGKQLFEHMYGPMNSYFNYGGNRFVMINTNSLEFADNSVPDMKWLEESLADTAAYRNAFLFMHVPPYHIDFDRSKEEQFANLIRTRKVRMAFNGHNHDQGVESPYAEDVKLVTVGSTSYRSFIKATIIGTKATYEVISY